MQVKLLNLPQTVKSVVLLKDDNYELFVNETLDESEINSIINQAFMQMSSVKEYK